LIAAKRYLQGKLLAVLSRARRTARIQRREFENQQSYIAKTEEYIRKNLAGQKTKMAKSRRTLLARLERVEAVTVDKASGNLT
jgi:ATP-binding cassette subfamily F protein 3